MPRNGEGFPGVSQPAVSTAASPSAAQGRAPAPAAETPTAGSASQRELADPTLAATAAKREQLKYLVRCALPSMSRCTRTSMASVSRSLESIGLAPRWLTEAMAPSEGALECGVSLGPCELFRETCPDLHPRYGGFRARAQGLRRRATDLLDFRRRVFGNLFAPAPVAYTCRG